MHKDENELSNKPKVPLRILRFPDIQEICGLSRTTVWRLIKARQFPVPLVLAPNCRGWIAEEVYQWLRSRPRAHTEG